MCTQMHKEYVAISINICQWQDPMQLDIRDMNWVLGVECLWAK